MLYSLSLILAASACVYSAAASPISSDSSIANLENRDTSDCTNLRADLSSTCWDELDISDYLASWNRTTPTCEASGGDDSNCCQSEEPWTTCFLRLSYGFGGTDCTTVNVQKCALSQLSANLDASIAPKVGYVVRNIVAINSLFLSYYQGMRLTTTNIAGSGSALATFHQILGGSADLGATLNNGNVVKAMVAGLPFWGTPPVLAGGQQQINPHVNTATAQTVAQSLQNTNPVSSLFFGAPYDKNDYDTTEQQIASSLTQAENLLLSSLSLIMTDVPSFSDWAAHGLYSGPPTPLNSLQLTPGMTSAFTTYVVSEVLSQAHFSATPATTPITKEAFQQSRTCTTLGDVCKDGNGHAYYWSQAFQTQYQINEPKNWALNSAVNSSGTQQPVIQQLGYEASAYGLLEYVETTDAYMPVLFDGAYNCTMEGKAGGSAVNLKADGSVDVACLSALPIYLAKGSACPAGAVQVNRKCPFGFNG